MPPKDANTVAEKLNTNKGFVIAQRAIPGANQCYDGKLEPLMETMTG